MSAATEFRSLTAQVLNEGCFDVTLELSGVSFIDSAGWDTVMTFRRDVMAAGGQVSLEGPSAAVVRLLTLIDADELGA